MPTYFMYCRKSSEAEDRQILSIDSQVNELKRHAAQKGIRIAAILTEAKSAKAPGRPVFNSLIQRVYKGEADGILCWKLDRLARNPVDGGAIIWAMKEHGVKIITPFQMYGESEDNVVWMYLEFGMAQKYVDDLSKNVKRGLRAKAESGWLPGPTPPPPYSVLIPCFEVTNSETAGIRPTRTESPFLGLPDSPIRGLLTRLHRLGNVLWTGGRRGGYVTIRWNG